MDIGEIYEIQQTEDELMRQAIDWDGLNSFKLEAKAGR